MTFCSVFRPVHSENPATVIPAISSLKLKEANGSIGLLGITVLLVWSWRRRSKSGDRAPPPNMFLHIFQLVRNISSEARLLDSENYELSRLRRTNANERNHLSEIHCLRSVGLLIAMDEEGLLGFVADNLSLHPLDLEKGADISRDALPQAGVVGLEDQALRAFQNRLLDKIEEPADVHVLPLWIRGNRARAPDDDAGVGELADHIYALRIKRVLLALGDHAFDADGGIQIAVFCAGGSFVHTHPAVGFGIRTGDRA